MHRVDLGGDPRTYQQEGREVTQEGDPGGKGCAVKAAHIVHPGLIQWRIPGGAGKPPFAK